MNSACWVALETVLVVHWGSWIQAVGLATVLGGPGLVARLLCAPGFLSISDI